MKNGVFWDVTPCGSCKNRISEKRSASFIRVTKISELETTLAVTSTASVVPSSPILVALMKKALSFSETLVITRATRRNISETILDRKLVGISHNYSIYLVESRCGRFIAKLFVRSAIIMLGRVRR
jgi:hypothetical protein